jgi:peptide/nickel transport system permease protein
MARFLFRRFLMLVAALVVSSMVIFASLYAAPGDPLAALTGGRTPSPAALATLRHRYHLDQPFLQRYWDYVVGLFHGDLGYSIAQQQNVSTLVRQRAGTSIELVIYASILIIIIGVALGLIGGLYRGASDHTVVVITTVAAAVPSFVAAIVLISVFSINLGWFPAQFNGSGGVDQFKHLTLPAFALAFSSMALVARVTRTAVREEMGHEHVQTAISRGIPWRTVVRRHVLRNAAIPITTVAGLTIASLIALDSVVEIAFSLNGLGSALVGAAQNNDLAVVQGISFILVASFVIINTIVDLLYAFLDPRVKLGAKAE